jgi:septal ring factor EnvC (AmiA/AmiB activator)
MSKTTQKRPSQFIRKATQKDMDTLREELERSRTATDRAVGEASMLRDKLFRLETTLVVTQRKSEAQSATIESLNKTVSDMVNEFAARDQRERAYRLVLADMIHSAIEAQKR